MNFEREFSILYVQPRLPRFLENKYSMLSCLKSGSGKSVFLIESKESTPEKFILKVAEGRYCALLEKEYKLLCELSLKAAVPKPVEFICKEQTGYLVREYISGDTLADKISKGQLTNDEVYEDIRLVCSAIEKLHSLEPPIILRDIKPENIIVKDGECFIIDFDAAREYDENAVTDTEFLGSKNTAAPEQYGFGQSNIRTDVFAIGKLMTYLLTGSYNESKISDAKARRIVKKCTRFSPDKRYKSCAAVAKATKSKIAKSVVIACAALACAAAAVFAAVYFFGTEHYSLSDNNTYGYSEQVANRFDSITRSALKNIDKQSGDTVRSGKTKREMIEFILNTSQYAVFGGEIWPCIASTDEFNFINYIKDSQLEKLDGTQIVALDTNSSASMSAGWYISGAVYTQDISLKSYRVYVDGEAGNYNQNTLADFFNKHFQAGEHLRIDNTRSMSFVSCDDNGFYFIEYGSDDNSDHHLRLRYYTFHDFTDYLNSTGKIMWYYEIEPSLNE